MSTAEFMVNTEIVIENQGLTEKEKTADTMEKTADIMAKTADTMANTGLINKYKRN